MTKKGRVKEIKGLPAETAVLVGSLINLESAIKEFSQSSDRYAKSMKRLNRILTLLTAILVLLTLVIALKSIGVP